MSFELFLFMTHDQMVVSQTVKRIWYSHNSTDHNLLNRVASSTLPVLHIQVFQMALMPSHWDLSSWQVQNLQVLVYFLQCYHSSLRFQVWDLCGLFHNYANIWLQAQFDRRAPLHDVLLTWSYGLKCSQTSLHPSYTPIQYNNIHCFQTNQLIQQYWDVDSF